MKSQTGRKPISNVVKPIASQPPRQPYCRIASWAINGMATNPAICATVATEVANARRATNQLFTAP